MAGLNVQSGGADITGAVAVTGDVAVVGNLFGVDGLRKLSDRVLVLYEGVTINTADSSLALSVDVARMGTLSVQYFDGTNYEANEVSMSAISSIGIGESSISYYKTDWYARVTRTSDTQLYIQTFLASTVLTPRITQLLVSY